MSQGALGEIVAVTNRQIEQYEMGPARVSARRLLLIVDALQVPAAFFQMNSMTRVIRARQHAKETSSSSSPPTKCTVA